jgi:nucleotide-binding universal stress UspA family protein
MLKSILVGLDGSPHSQLAVELGLGWAKKFDALLVGLGIIDEPAVRRPEPMHLGAAVAQVQFDDRLLAEARRKVEQYLEQFALQCAQQQVACKVLEDVGIPAEQIALEAQRYDIVLLGRRTYFHVDPQEGPEDTLSRVLRHCARPVLTVPNSVRPGRCVMVAYDGSLQAGRSVQAFQATGLDEGKQVHVVCVGPNHVDASRHADRAAEYLRFHDIKAVAHPVASTAGAAQVLLEKVRELDPGLVVMGAFGQPNWREFFFGSVTRRFLKETPAPLFLYH